MMIYTAEFTTPLGTMQCLANDKALLLVAFKDYKKLDAKISKILQHTQASLSTTLTSLLQETQRQLLAYCAGDLHIFSLPLDFIGTSFQEAVWRTLISIPYGQTWSYKQLATTVGNPNAFRAVAQTNGKNYFAVIVPCHRVVNTNNSLGGYSSGLERKRWLLNHESSQQQYL